VKKFTFFFVFVFLDFFLFRFFTKVEDEVEDVEMGKKRSND